MMLFRALASSQGVRLVGTARAVRWFGWGFGEALIPVFIFSFSAGFAEAGLVKSLYDIALLVALPIVGGFVDRVSARTLIIVGLLLYPFIGISYFLAGLTGVVLFVVVARVLNGVCWGIDMVGTDTYLRRVAPAKLVGSAFGYVETIGNFGWIVAALAGMWLVSFVPIHYLLLAVVPFSLIALFLVLRAPRDPVVPVVQPLSLLGSYRETLEALLSWGPNFRMLAVLAFFLGLVGVLIGFFIPISAYQAGAEPAGVIFLGIVATLPTLFGYSIGRFVDRSRKRLLVGVGLVAVAGILVTLAFYPFYLLMLAASFMLGILLEGFYVLQKGLVTVLTAKHAFGRCGSSFEELNVLGCLAAPLLIGVAMDSLGFSNLLFVVAAVAIVLAGAFVLLSFRDGSVF